MSSMIPPFLNRQVHEFLGSAPALIILFFCTVNIFLALDELHSTNYSIVTE